MSADTARGLAHLIGSVPLPTTEEVFRRLGAALGPLLSRMPDGETGERRRWIYWQRTMLERHPAMEVDADAGLLELRQWDGSLLRRTDLLRFRPGRRSRPRRVPDRLRGGGAGVLGRSSTRLRREGALPADLRFQVCLPTPMSSAFMYVSPRAHDDYQRAYERSLRRDLDRIVADIPRADLSIQWDICQEVLVLENYFPSRPADYEERIFALLARLGDAVPADVELGYHLCYGSPADQHLVMPKDTAILAELARAIVAAGEAAASTSSTCRCRASATTPRTSRRCATSRCPRACASTWACIHHDDGAGDRRRIDVARAAVADVRGGHRVRLGPRRARAARRPAREPPPRGGLPGDPPMTDRMPGPASHTFFSQRLRLHYVDWGNPDKPPLLMLHGGRDHCRNWDWAAAALRDDWHIIAPDLRGHGDSQWSADGNYAMTGYIYDLAQLIHGQRLAPVTIVAHSLGGNVALRYAGIYPETVARLVAIEGAGAVAAEASPSARPSRSRTRMDEWIREQRKLAGRLPRRYASIEDAFRRMQEENPHLSAEQARHLTVHGVNQNEDGTYSWKFDNYVRVFPPYDMRGQDLKRPLVAHHVPDAPALRQGEPVRQPGRGRARRAVPRRHRHRHRPRRPLAAPRPARRVPAGCPRASSPNPLPSGESGAAGPRTRPPPRRSRPASPPG